MIQINEEISYERLAAQRIRLGDPDPAYRYEVFSKDEAVGLAVSVLHTITEELIPGGGLAYGSSSQFQKARRVMADARKAQQALQDGYPRQDTAAVERRNDAVMLDTMQRALLDAQEIVAAAAKLLDVLGLSAFEKHLDKYAERGRVITRSNLFLTTLEAQIGPQLQTFRESLPTQH